LNNTKSESKMDFIDLFAGCGGLSLGLMQAGWNGLFAIEKSSMAFETLRFNLVDRDHKYLFDWPDWFPCKAMDIQTVIQNYNNQLDTLRGIPLLAGGPPCQGFSISGKRKPDDVRNRLFEQYLDFVGIVEPKMLLFENVREFAKSFSRTERGKKGEEILGEQVNVNEEFQEQLDKLGYKTFVRQSVKAKDFGVPQLRPRYFLVAIRQSLLSNYQDLDPFKELYSRRQSFLKEHNLPSNHEVTLENAISDLRMVHGTVQCIEKGMMHFQQGLFGPTSSPYQELMRKNPDGTSIQDGQIADSHRFPNHQAWRINPQLQPPQSCPPAA
jgi:DNA (cytosine-5)-methyltransferase 1